MRSLALLLAATPAAAAAPTTISYNPFDTFAAIHGWEPRSAGRYYCYTKLFCEETVFDSAQTPNAQRVLARAKPLNKNMNLRLGVYRDATCSEPASEATADGGGTNFDLSPPATYDKVKFWYTGGVGRAHKSGKHVKLGLDNNADDVVDASDEAIGGTSQPVKICMGPPSAANGGQGSEKVFNQGGCGQFPPTDSTTAGQWGTDADIQALSGIYRDELPLGKDSVSGANFASSALRRQQRAVLLPGFEINPLNYFHSSTDQNVTQTDGTVFSSHVKHQNCMNRAQTHASAVGYVPNEAFFVESLKQRTGGSHRYTQDPKEQAGYGQWAIQNQWGESGSLSASLTTKRGENEADTGATAALQIGPDVRKMFTDLSKAYESKTHGAKSAQFFCNSRGELGMTFFSRENCRGIPYYDTPACQANTYVGHPGCVDTMVPELKERPMPEVGGTSTFLAITPLLFILSLFLYWMLSCFICCRICRVIGCEC